MVEHNPLHNPAAWLEYAAVDLAAAKKCLSDELTLRVSVYLAQQSAEKRLKAFLALHKTEIPKIHSLINLLERCVSIHHDFITLQEPCENLRSFGETRYPANARQIETEDARECLEQAKHIHVFVKKCIKSALDQNSQQPRKITSPWSY